MSIKDLRLKTLLIIQNSYKMAVVFIGIGILLNAGCDSGTPSIVKQKSDELTKLQAELEAAKNLIESLEEVNSESAAQLVKLKVDLDAVGAQLAQADHEIARQAEECQAIQAKREEAEQSLAKLAFLATDRQERIDAAVKILQKSLESPQNDQ